MRRILVPLDGSELATRALDDARRLAGPDGELILVADVTVRVYRPDGWKYQDSHSLDTVQAYLDEVAQSLRAQGVRVHTHVLVINDISMSIDEAARIYEVDMIVCATHGRGPVGRLIQGGVAWRAVANSSVPIALHHVDVTDEEPVLRLAPRRILVPLDGSELATTAVPLAVQLAQEWKAPLYLITVIPTLPDADAPYGNYAMALSHNYTDDIANARAYLDEIGNHLPVETHRHVFTGGVVSTLVQAAHDWDITDVVMASHGRTGLSRAILGSVADALIHRLHLPIVIMPSHAHLVERSGEAKSTGNTVPAFVETS